MLQQAKQIVGNDPRAALARIQNSGATVNLPNGQVKTIGELIAMADGKSAMQFLSELM